MSARRRHNLTRMLVLPVLALVLVLAPWARSETGGETPLLLQRESKPQLHRLIRVTPRILCGAEPTGESAFQALADMGVKTVVCVDGSRPNVELARRFDLRYVHIPIGYDRIGNKQANAMVHAVRSSTGRVFVHCHHGRQRGPAMAAIAAVADGAPGAANALRVLRTAGTSNAYRGLWRDVEAFHLPAATVNLPNLNASVAVDPLVRKMAVLDRLWDQAKNAGLPENGRPENRRHENARDNKSFAHIASLVAGIEGDAEHYDESFHAELQSLRRMALQLDDARRDTTGRRFEALAKKMQTSCNRCHAEHRDR